MGGVVLVPAEGSAREILRRSKRTALRQQAKQTAVRMSMVGLAPSAETKQSDPFWTILALIRSGSR